MQVEGRALAIPDDAGRAGTEREHCSDHVEKIDARQLANAIVGNAGNAGQVLEDQNDGD